MKVVNRRGGVEEMMFDKISASISDLCTDHQLGHVDGTSIAQKICASLYDGIQTSEIDVLASETAASMSTRHPDYARLAALIVVRNMQKITPDRASEAFAREHAIGFMSDRVYDIVVRHKDAIDAAIVSARDYDFDYFGLKTLDRGYLAKDGKTLLERPQYMWMRVALGIWHDDIDKVLQTYEYLSQKYFTHATPTLFNAGTKHPQLSSCFLMGVKEDSIDGIYATLGDCAQISKWAGGIGVHIHDVRCRGSPIAGTSGVSSGVMPMLKVFNATARYVNQSGKRNGSIAIYVEPSHPDIFEVLEARKNHGDEEARARDLFYAMWIPDLFMKRVEANGKWSLFCPNKCPGLSDALGEDYVRLYEKYEAEGRYEQQVDAQKLWFAICTSQIETGTPFLLYKDACNAKSNQKHRGTIKSSNLCTEIVEYTSPDEIAVCNLASMCLPRFVTPDGRFDFHLFHQAVKVVTHNLDRVIDVTYYPMKEARVSNERNRPIGIGVQGLADVFMRLHLDFEGEAARRLNRDIFETLYHAALEASCERARDVKETYPTYEGSPASKGQLQFDLWGYASQAGRHDWSALKDKIATHGLRNSLLVAPMPTASTSQIMGNNEAFEPYTSNIYVRRTLAGEFVIVNKHLVKDLLDLGLWNEDLKNKIVAQHGSIQDIPEIPDTLKPIYKTAWEMKQKSLIDMAAERGVYVCQSQSLNLFMAQPTVAKLSSMHFYAWKKGLKTGMYYLRTKPVANPIQFTIEPSACVTCSS